MSGVVVALALLAGLAAAATPHAHDRPDLRSRLVMEPVTLRPGGGSGDSPPAGSPLHKQEPERFSGYFRLNHTSNAHMFFFLFEARYNPDNAPVVVWMTGGPGCSSELAVFFENGPWQIHKNLTLSETKYGWDTNAHMVFVDQPVNTGFSWSDDDSDTCYDEICVADDMLDFIVALFQSRPKLAKKDFYVTGESYAGHYVPAVSHRVWAASQSGEVEPIHLKGLAIGNGLTFPAVQYGAYADYAVQNGLMSTGLRDLVMKFYPLCRLGLDMCTQLQWAPECLLAVNFCQLTMFGPVMMLNPAINVYDVRKKCEGPLCYREFELLDQYINQPEVRKALGVGDREWQACNMEVHEAMMGDWGIDYSTMLPDMLKAGIQVLVYAGDQDLICNWLGNRRWVDALDWYGAADWAKAVDEVWQVEGEEAGLVKAAGPLTFLRVAGAGHMVPMDQPRNALEMITRFTRGQPLDTVPLAVALEQPGGKARAQHHRKEVA